MRVASVLFVLAFLAATSALAKEEHKPRGKPRPIGVRWHANLQEGLALARREGRPILFAVNAREDERANIELATSQYRSRMWGEATRDYVCFVCNPNEHRGPDGLCTRYPGIPCATHKAALKEVARRFGSDLITPQHVILEPDGQLAFRKEYYTRVVRPALLETWLSTLAPGIAFSRAGISREKKIKSLVATEQPDQAAQAKTWLLSEDGLAAASIANVLDEVFDAPGRLALIETLAAAGAAQAPVLELIAEDRISYPDEDVPETIAWIQALLRADRSIGLRAAARALSRSEEEGVRGQILRASHDVTKLDLKQVPTDERYPLWEALALAGDARGGARAAPLPQDPLWRHRILRALRRGGLATGERSVDLAGALANPKDTPALRRALLHATQVQASTHRAAIEQVLADARWLGLRAAAAVALTRAGFESEDDVVVRTLRAMLFDPVEGSDLRAVIRDLLGEDPGTNVEEWVRMIQTRVQKAEDK